jgi:hypothetical protein
MAGQRRPPSESAVAQRRDRWGVSYAAERLVLTYLESKSGWRYFAPEISLKAASPKG